MCSTTLNCKVHHGQEARVQEPEGAGHIPSSRQQRARNTRVLQPRSLYSVVQDYSKEMVSCISHLTYQNNPSQT